MEFEIKDPMARMLDIQIVQVGETGLTTRAEVQPDFCNAYSAAHGGYLYTLGHITAALSAQFCLGRQAVVVDADCQYVRSVLRFPVQLESELLRSGRELIVYRVHVRDGCGILSMEQTVTLKEVDYPEAAKPAFRQTIFPAGPDAEPDPELTIEIPRLSTSFAARCHIYVLGRGESGMIYGADLFPEVCNLYGAAHGGLIYTCCDVAAGGSAAFLMEKKPVTVSSSVHYLRSITTGPVRAEAKLVRAGRQMYYYNIEVTDGNGKLSAAAEFVLHLVDYQATGIQDEKYRKKAFKA